MYKYIYEKNSIFFDIDIKIIKLLKFFLCKFFILIKKKRKNKIFCLFVCVVLFVVCYLNELLLDKVIL